MSTRAVWVERGKEGWSGCRIRHSSKNTVDICQWKSRGNKYSSYTAHIVPKHKLANLHFS